MLRALLLLPGTFAADIAEALGDDSALDLLGVLVDHHLVARDGDRLRVPVVVAEYAAELTSPDERATAMGVSPPTSPSSPGTSTPICTTTASRRGRLG